LCDGAKIGCALKVSTCTQAAVQSAIFAVRGVVIPQGQGILGRNAEESIVNLGRLSGEGTANTDQVILDLILNNQSA
ncbi:MAG TPA: serine dehydratase subunit alpha family protein, partial [Clostridia bacterium]|nr:serine dehydratase subunit alpha family protein [Clostridia bacterium]